MKKVSLPGYVLVLLLLPNVVATMGDMYERVNRLVEQNSSWVGYVEYWRNGASANTGEPLVEHVIAFIETSGNITAALTFDGSYGSYDNNGSISIPGSISEEAFRATYVYPYGGESLAPNTSSGNPLIPNSGSGGGGDSSGGGSTGGGGGGFGGGSGSGGGGFGGGGGGSTCGDADSSAPHCVSF